MKGAYRLLPFRATKYILILVSFSIADLFKGRHESQDTLQNKIDSNVPRSKGQVKTKSHYYAISFGQCICTKLPRRDFHVSELLDIHRDKAVWQPLSFAVESIFQILKTVEKQYGRAVRYCSYPMANRLTRNDETVSGYIPKTAKKAEWQMETHFFNPSNSISIIWFLCIIQLTWDTNNINDEAATWILPFFVKNE